MLTQSDILRQREVRNNFLIGICLHSFFRISLKSETACVWTFVYLYRNCLSPFELCLDWIMTREIVCKTWNHINAGLKAEYWSVSVNGGEKKMHEKRFSGCPLHPMTICGSKNKNLIIRTDR